MAGRATAGAGAGTPGTPTAPRGVETACAACIGSMPASAAGATAPETAGAAGMAGACAETTGGVPPDRCGAAETALRGGHGVHRRELRRVDGVAAARGGRRGLRGGRGLGCRGRTSRNRETLSGRHGIHAGECRGVRRVGRPLALRCRGLEAVEPRIGPRRRGLLGLGCGLRRGSLRNLRAGRCGDRGRGLRARGLIRPVHRLRCRRRAGDSRGLSRRPGLRAGDAARLPLLLGRRARQLRRRRRFGHGEGRRLRGRLGCRPGPGFGRLRVVVGVGEDLSVFLLALAGIGLVGSILARPTVLLVLETLPPRPVLRLDAQPLILEADAPGAILPVEHPVFVLILLIALPVVPAMAQLAARHDAVQEAADPACHTRHYAASPSMGAPAPL